MGCSEYWPLFALTCRHWDHVLFAHVCWSEFWTRRLRPQPRLYKINNTASGMVIDWVKVQCRHLFSALNAWAVRAKYTTSRSMATQFPGHGCMDDLTTERNCDSQVTWVIVVLVLFFYILPMDVCTTRHWQMSGRLVQESNVRTVAYVVNFLDSFLYPAFIWQNNLYKAYIAWKVLWVERH